MEGTQATETRPLTVDSDKSAMFTVGNDSVNTADYRSRTIDTVVMISGSSFFITPSLSSSVESLSHMSQPSRLQNTIDIKMRQAAAAADLQPTNRKSKPQVGNEEHKLVANHVISIMTPHPDHDNTTRSTYTSSRATVVEGTRPTVVEARHYVIVDTTEQQGRNGHANNPASFASARLIQDNVDAIRGHLLEYLERKIEHVVETQLAVTTGHVNADVERLESKICNMAIQVFRTGTMILFMLFVVCMAVLPLVSLQGAADDRTAPDENVVRRTLVIPSVAPSLSAPVLDERDTWSVIHIQDEIPFPDASVSYSYSLDALSSDNNQTLPGDVLLELYVSAVLQNAHGDTNRTRQNVDPVKEATVHVGNNRIVSHCQGELGLYCEQASSNRLATALFGIGVV